MAADAPDAHARPPQAIRDTYKKLQKAKDNKSLDEVTRDGYEGAQRASSQSRVEEAEVRHRQVFEDFLGKEIEGPFHMPVAEACNVPGLLIYRNLLPPEVQMLLLDKMFHRDLNNPEHLTNVHLHYDVPYPSPGTSYFDTAASVLQFTPQDPTVHKPLTTPRYLNKKLRWMTLGGQYDWTNKVYPAALPPAFPEDIAQLVGGLFNMKPEAAIVNLYSPGDTLSVHRDVSEECNRPLASISLGCDGIFLVGLDGATDGEEPRMATLRLQSGDAVVMSGESRYAWHGVPKVIEGTCPDWMEDWPCVGADTQEFELLGGWMKGKRVNLNVRQMFA